MTLPASLFADAFRAHIMPDLRLAASMHGRLMEVGFETFTEAFAAVMRLAISCGATHLPDHHFSMLDDWIGSALLDAAAEQRATSERVWRDVMQWEATVALMLDMGAVGGR